jgi:hypothetical protein
MVELYLHSPIRLQGTVLAPVKLYVSKRWRGVRTHSFPFLYTAPFLLSHSPQPKKPAGNISAWRFQFYPYHTSTSFRSAFLLWFLELPVGRPGAMLPGWSVAAASSWVNCAALANGDESTACIFRQLQTSCRRHQSFRSWWPCEYCVSAVHVVYIPSTGTGTWFRFLAGNKSVFTFVEAQEGKHTSSA